MRALPLLAAVLLLAAGLYGLVPGSAAVRATGGAAADVAPRGEHAEQPGAALADQPIAGRTPVEPLRAGPGSPEVAPPQPTARGAADLRLLVLEHGTRVPLPEVGVQVLVYREQALMQGEFEATTLAVAGDGSAWLTAEELRDATDLIFLIDDPELGPGVAVFLERPIKEILASGEPHEIFVPRGTWCDFLIIDRAGRSIEGAVLEGSCLRPTRTGPDGRGRVRTTVPPPRTVQVWAPGHRVEKIRVPLDGEPWIFELGDASRLELALVGDEDVRAYHVEVRLPETMRQRTFYQERNVLTPGRPLDGTPARWSGNRKGGASRWNLGFNDAGVAVLDQLYDESTVEVELMRFGEQLDFRSIALVPREGTTRVELRAPAPPSELAGRVVDEAHRPVAGALLRMAPVGGRATIDLGSSSGFPVWAPAARTDEEGEFRLPAPRDDRTVIVVSREGLAHRAFTVAELEAADRVVELERGRTVVLEVLGRDGEPLDGGWSSGMAYLHVRPSMHLGQDVWRDASPQDHPAAEGRDTRIPYFLFADLPSGVVEFRFTHLAEDERLWHDTSIEQARFVSRSVLDELGIGK